MSYLIISPCRNEAKFMRQTLDSVAGQSILPEKWVIVDDGSTDETANILSEYAEKYTWISVITNENRGARAVGPGVIEAFYKGYDSINPAEFDYICKLDMDLILPSDYFKILMEKMAENPRLGCFSGKPYYMDGDRQVSEKCGDEMCVGASKFYRRQCFEEIGGFVREVMWDAIDCHRCRFLGWIACSSDDPKIRFIHLRPMGSSQNGILTGRMRHGYGQYYMGSSILYFMATAAYRMVRPPYIIGGLAMAWGFIKSMICRKPQQSDRKLISFIRKYQRRALVVGKKRAIDEINDAMKPKWEQAHHER
ncbi:MAG: glycosyltransferase family A protein [Emcibacteraceae bacterium]